MLPWNNFPFNDEFKKMLQNKGNTEIEKYVQDMVTKMLPKNMEGITSPQEWMKGNSYQQQPDQTRSCTELETSIFETHDFIFIRIPIKEENWLKEMKIFYTSHEVIIEHIPSPDAKNTYPLPAPVRKKGATAAHKDGILEIRIPKGIQTQVSEISIPEA